MRKLYFIILFVLCTLGIVWAGSTTTNFSLYKPAIDETGWGASVNTNFDTVDSEMKTNRDHLSADGSSHTFIDQSVVSGATPTFTGTNFTGVPTSGITGGNWKVNYINGSGALTEVALGDSGDVLVSQGTSAAPVMQAQSGSGSGGGSVEGTAILSTGEGGATKFLREDGDGTSSWQIATASHAGTITWSGTSILETGTAFQFGDGTDATVTHTYANTGTNVTIAYSNAAMAVTAALTATNLSGTNTGDVTHALDLVTTAPITGGQDNVFVGADGDVTVDITVLKDLVTTAPITGGTDDVFTGSDSDITVALDFTAVWDFGGASSIELVNSATPTTNATGEIALDTTITDHQPLWQYFDGGENMTIIAIDTSQLPALDNEIIKYDAAADKFVLEADATGGSTKMKFEKHAVIETPVAGDLFLIYKSRYAWTPNSLVGAIAPVANDSADTVSIEFWEGSDDGDTVTSMGILTVTSDSTSDSGLTGQTIDDNDWIIIDILSIGGNPTQLTVGFEGTED